jgi:hypothetical protein
MNGRIGRVLCGANGPESEGPGAGNEWLGWESEGGSGSGQGWFGWFMDELANHNNSDNCRQGSDWIL